MRENISKIQYLSVADSKIYKVTEMDSRNLRIEATKTALSISDVPESEVFSVEEFGEFRVKLINSKGNNCNGIVDFKEWVKRHKEYKIAR